MVHQPNTLYGANGKAGIIPNILSRGLAKQVGDHYVLLDDGLKWVDPEIIMANQADKLGSEEHKQLMVKMIRKLQSQLILSIVSREKYSFDILGVPVNEKKRGLWDIRKARGYECQTSARKDSVGINTGKSEMWGVPTVWVVDREERLEGIKKNTDGEYLKL